MTTVHTIENGVEGKVCSACRQWKSLPEYGRDKRLGDKLTCQCRACRKAYATAYRQTEHGKAVMRKAQRKYCGSDKDLARRHRIYQTEKWKATCRRSARAWSKRNPIKRQAAHAVCYAVAKSLLPAISSCSCSDCHTQAEEYHHESYEKEHWLDVTPLCRKCHMIRHDRIAS